VGAKPGFSPIGATLAGATPYLLASADQFRPPPPPAFGSPAFQTAVDEIRTFVDNRTPAQLAVAAKWAYNLGTFTPPGSWTLTAATYIGEDRLDERAATHVFAVLGATMYDAFIACFDAKYHYLTPRPSQADPRIVAPPPVATGAPTRLPNHPSYPAGHSCNAASAATVLTHFFPDRAAELAGWVPRRGWPACTRASTTGSTSRPARRSARRWPGGRSTSTSARGSSPQPGRHELRATSVVTR
jgi:membrane-associated phospholipid phosphatase